MKNRILDQIIRSFALVKKDVMIYYSKGPVVLMGVLWPAIMFISFAFGRGMAIENLMPGLIGVSVFFTCSAIAPVAFPWETAQRTLERLVSAPVAIWTILFGDMLASALVGILGIPCALCMQSEAAASPRLFVFVRYEPISAHYLPQILTIRSIDFVIVKATNMPSVICPEVVSVSVAKAPATPSPKPIHA